MASDGSLKFDVKIDESGFNTGVGKLGSIAQSALGVLTGNLLTSAVGKIADLGKAAIEVGSSFEAAGSQLAATMGTSTDNIQELLDKAKELGAATSFSATEAAEGLNILAQSGLTAEEQLASIGDVLNLAAAGSLSLESAASYTTGTIKGFGDSMDNARYYTDLIAKGATLANTNVNDLGEALSGAASTAAGYGQTAEDTTTALLRLAEQNVTGSTAVTALNRAMADLYTPTDAAKKALDELGVSAYDLNGNARDINVVMDELNASLSGMSAEQANAYKNTIFTAQGLQAFNKMTVSSTDKVQEFRDGLATASDGIGSAAEQAETMLDNLKGRLTIFQSAAEGLGVAIYESVGDNLSGLVDIGTDALSQLTEAFNTGGVEGMIEAGGNIIANLIAGIISGIPDFLETASSLAIALISGIASALPSVLSAGYDLISYLVDGIIEGLPTLLTSGTDSAVGFIDSISDKLPDVIAKGMELLAKLSNGIIENLPLIIASAGRIITSLTNAITKNLPSVLASGVSILGKVVTGITSNLPKIITTAGQVIAKFAAAIASNLPQILQKGIELIGKLVAGIIQAIPTAVAAIPKVISGIVGAFKGYDWGSIGSNIISGIAKGISNGVGAIASAAKNAAKSALDSAKSFLGIKSPSRRFRDEVGKMMALGLGVGFEKNIPEEDIESSLEKVFNRANNRVAKMTAETPSMVGNVVRSTTNNYTDMVVDYRKLKKAQKEALNEANEKPIILNNRVINRAIRDGKGGPVLA